ncbi:hypothetical protein [Allobaculum sp. JKK-2023]|uniref:hypothetical protein n=1 Tax=Allobaculum sp. JKK-2023 TaxID=3108943 RepID=UPI002B060DB8|nr:hypothetical protein [Allobaculum sp. JKK-2023]
MSEIIRIPKQAFRYPFFVQPEDSEEQKAIENEIGQISITEKTGGSYWFFEPALKQYRSGKTDPQKHSVYTD